ncbi:class C sortase [Vagococcus entomophilus]|uniref:Class C sortase n=1 Tax=Vagococcus entomophilus TaxID=1160095 RepID=A0A430AFM1_9ENTE|nr:class C sortase [Vagococcus entomophilus]RSU06522.1 hypothetical protein CBF30_09745 [Vagococcus entomophilus]
MKRKIVYLLFGIGLLCLLFPPLAKYYDQYKMNQVVANFLQKKAPSAKKVQEYQQYNKQLQSATARIDDPFTTVDGSDSSDTIFASIEIPAIKMNLPIYLGASEKHLMKGAAQIEGTSYPIGGKGTHAVLAGHTGYANKELFSRIHELEPQDYFYIHSPVGKLTYKVVDKRKIKVTEVEYLNIQPNRDLVTLLTCPYVDSKHYRIIVIGERVEK